MRGYVTPISYCVVTSILSIGRRSFNKQIPKNVLIKYHVNRLLLCFIQKEINGFVASLVRRTAYGRTSCSWTGFFARNIYCVPERQNVSWWHTWHLSLKLLLSEMSYIDACRARIFKRDKNYFDCVWTFNNYRCGTPHCIKITNHCVKHVCMLCIILCMMWRIRSPRGNPLFSGVAC